jgi:hypothetical protein
MSVGDLATSLRLEAPTMGALTAATYGETTGQEPRNSVGRGQERRISHLTKERNVQLAIAFRR